MSHLYVILILAVFHMPGFAGGNSAAKPISDEDIFHTRIFEEPLLAVGPTTGEENGRLADALRRYSQRKSADDFSSLVKFVADDPNSPWIPSLLSNLGTEYYNTANYSLALEAWARAWELTKSLTDNHGKKTGDRVVGELAFMYARLGRMDQLSATLQSVETRTFLGPATEKISGAREALWTMQNRPEVAFRCGPLALHRIMAAGQPSETADLAIYRSESTQKGTSLSQVAELSRAIGLNYQMAFREKGSAFLVPAVVHWKVGHYAAMTRHAGDKFLLQDPTFGNDVWATTNALENETSGYFLVPAGELPKGWRAVSKEEGGKIWGKGVTSNNDPRNTFPDAPRSQSRCDEADQLMSNVQKKQQDAANSVAGNIRGMAVPGVHLMTVSLNINDAPVGYAPPVGPSVFFTVRYSHREAYQPGTFTYANLGPKWTCDWVSYITDNPQSSNADVNYYVRGGGTKTFTGFDTNTQAYAHQQYGQAKLTRTAPANYEMVQRDGSKLVFGRSDGATGTSRKVFLTQVVDPFGNAVTLNYDGNLRLTNIVDALGQATTLSYTNASDSYKITRVTDPFGRFASFQYDSLGRLTNITDVIGITSRFVYEGSGDYINALVTPYGTTSFARGGTGTTRWLETTYPDGSRERVEFNQSNTLGIGSTDPATMVPKGMGTFNEWLFARNTYYWSRTATATAYGDYTKAKIYHWLHGPDLATTSGFLESVKEPLEGRVWYDYFGQSSVIYAGSIDKPRHVGRVLEDFTTQLTRYDYNAFGNVTNTVDPAGRRFSYIYATNGIDLLEVRMTRAGKSELLYRATYNSQHLPLTITDAAGQTTTNSYNARGQLITTTNPKNETTTNTYDANGYLIAVDGPLPGTNDTATATYDAFGRVRTKTDSSGYTVTIDYDALDRVTKITYPDSTFDQFTFNRLDPSVLRDRAGRETLLEHNSLRDLVKQTDPLGRVTQFQWCRCGGIKSLTDPMGRTTEWKTDVQGRLIAKQYGDGSQITYGYDNAGRLRQITDEKQQVRQFGWNRDNTLRSMSFQNTAAATPSVNFEYDPDYNRLVSRTDWQGTTVLNYHTVTTSPTLGAGKLQSIDGPLANDTVTYTYDELGRRATKAIDGFAQSVGYDLLGRLIGETNALGAFAYGYEGVSGRRNSETFPNGLTFTRVYEDGDADFALKQITHQVGPTLLSQFIYNRSNEDRIVYWSQQLGVAEPNIYTFGYDAVDQLLSASITNAGALVGAFTYNYDLAGNRLREETPGATNVATYNALNQITVITAATGSAKTNEWDAMDRLAAVTVGAQRTEFSYDGAGQMVRLRQLINGSEVSDRRFLWTDGRLSEERDALGVVLKRFFAQGVKIESGPNTGTYFYTRDHLGSIRELVDTSGSVRARYSYDPFGRCTLNSGDVPADFGFAGMFWAGEAQLYVTMFRAYDPEQGRWLSRDPLLNAEIEEGANLYAYVGNNPINAIDPLGLFCCQKEMMDLNNAQMPMITSGLDSECMYWKAMQMSACNGPMGQADPQCINANTMSLVKCEMPARDRLMSCLSKPCVPSSCNPAPAPPGPPPPVPAGRSFPEGPDVATTSTGRPAERSAASTPQYNGPY